MRAKSRAMAVSLGAALVVVPLSGVAAVAISGSGSPTPDAQAVAVQGTKYVSEVEQIGAPVAAKTDSVFQMETPALTVTVNPKPVVVVPVVHRATVSARTVANSADAAQAIAGSAIIAEASQYVGIAYRSGGTSPSTGFDCSGFVSYVYAQFGISLPHNSAAYYGVGTAVDSPQPGDIIVTPGHVGLYAGPNLQIDSPRPGKTIEFRSIWQVNPVYVRVTG
jgi:peptidoglycan DL-endopeptidase CwlO